MCLIGQICGNFSPTMDFDHLKCVGHLIAYIYRYNYDIWPSQSRSCGQKVIAGHSLFMRLECNTYHRDMQLNIYIISLLHAHAWQLDLCIAIMIQEPKGHNRRSRSNVNVKDGILVIDSHINLRTHTEWYIINQHSIS